MNSRSKYLIKNVEILTISNFASKILVFLLVPLYTSVLSTEEVGLYDLVVSTISLLFPVLTLNIVDAMMRFLMDVAKSKEEVVSIGIKYVLASILPVSLFLVIASKMEMFSSIHGFEILIFLYYIFFCLNQFLVQFSKGIENVAAMGVSGVLGTVTMLASNIILLVIVKAGLHGFFIAYILGQAVPAIYLLLKTRFLRYINKRVINKNLQREMLCFCVPLIATAIGWWVNSASDKYVVSFICGVTANGLLSVSYKIPAIINTLQQIFTQAWQISAVKEYGEKGASEFYGRTFIYLNILMAIACSWLIILAKPIGHVLYQKDFFSAWQYVPFLLIATVVNSASGFMGPILSAKKASKPMAMSAVYGASANVVMNILFVNLIGVQGATIATVISSFIIYWVRKIEVGDEIKIEGYSTVLITWFLLCVQALIEIYTSLWWLEVVVMGLILIINWTVIKGIIQMGILILKR
ncbi:MAG: polysaccharide biosynthesis protein [Lachnospiraceae bacterium]|nr:polysaccharide biosynthesis protein [Lachnospiraceae bacterium]